MDASRAPTTPAHGLTGSPQRAAIPGLVSVIICTYRREQMLRNAVASALRQSYANLEVIVSDDATLETTRQLCAAFGDARVRYRCNATNLGQCRNHIAALGEATGEFLAVLNDDDSWEPEFLTRLVPVLRASANLALAFSDHHVTDGEGRLLPSESQENSVRWHRHQLREGVYVPFHHLVVSQTIPLAQASVFRRDALALESLPPDAGPAYDIWISYLLSKTGRGAYYCPERLTRYRAHAGSLTVTKERVAWALGAASLRMRMLNDPDFQSFTEILRRGAAADFLAAAMSTMRLGQARSAWLHVERALRLQVSPRGLAAAALAMLPMTVSGGLLRLADRVRSGRPGRKRGVETPCVAPLPRGDACWLGRRAPAKRARRCSGD